MPITAQVWGGLGNQMFVYAFARALALRGGDTFALDITSRFPKDPYKRVFGLDVFKLEYERGDEWCCRPDWLGSLSRRTMRAANRRRPLERKTFVEEPRDPAYLPEVAAMETRSRRVYFRGYWQTARYFDDFADTIWSDFELKAPIDDASRALAEKMSGCDAIGLHARRLHGVPAGEEASGPKAGIKQISVSYYQTAVARMCEGLENPHLFCFGDAKDWLREHARFDIPVTIVDGRPGEEWAFQDIHLMSLCQRIAIANSSFSWWGAWLGRHPRKQVYYPRPESWSWFWNQDIIPADWIGIDD